MRAFVSFSTSLVVASFATAQLSGRVGPTTTREQKANVKTCNIMSYGGEASASVDNSAAIMKAWGECKNGGQVYMPAGSYGLENWVTLDGGKGVSINLDGTIFRTGQANGNMILVTNTADFEFYSSTSKGAVQGYGYEFHASELFLDQETDGAVLTSAENLYGPRILRLVNVTDFSVHDVALVDAPAFHFSMDTCKNGEVYNMVIRGANKGGLDGIDVWGDNIWIHDVEVTNKDECVTVKSPASHILIESIFCNWSGGCAIGSLSDNTKISNVVYSHIYSQNCNQMLMIKSKGGSGSVRDSSFSNFQGHANAYVLNIDSNWGRQAQGVGDGVALLNLTFSNWTGTTSGGSAGDGTARPALRMLCPSKVPCTEMVVDRFNVWTDQGSSVKWTCENAYGSGGCAHGPKSVPGSQLLGNPPFSDTLTVTEKPDYKFDRMPDELTDPGPLTAPIAIPPVPKMFFPGRQPIHALLGA